MDTTLPNPHVLDVSTAQFRSAVVDRSRDVPVLVDFWATWCAPCRALGPVLEALAAEYAGGFVLAKVDTEQEQALAAEFKIRSIPTVLLFKGGTAVNGFQGALPVGQVKAFLTKHGIEPGVAKPLVFADDPAERVAQLRAAIAESPDRDTLKLELAIALLALDERDESARLMEALPAALYGDVRAVRARARLALMQRAAAATDHPQHEAAIRQLLSGDLSSGLAQLIELLRAEKHDEHSAARAALVDAFAMIEDDDVVRDWRRRMASVLF